MYGSQYEQLQWHAKEVMLLLEGFEGEKSSDFLPKFSGIVSSRKVAGLSQSVAPLPPPDLTHIYTHNINNMCTT